jgi:hypothetical protein
MENETWVLIQKYVGSKFHLYSIILYPLAKAEIFNGLDNQIWYNAYEIRISHTIFWFLEFFQKRNSNFSNKHFKLIISTNNFVLFKHEKVQGVFFYLKRIHFYSVQQNCMNVVYPLLWLSLHVSLQNKSVSKHLEKKQHKYRIYHNNILVWK